MKRRRQSGSPGTGVAAELPLVGFVYGILGLTSLRHHRRVIPRDAVYFGFKELAAKYPQYLGSLYFETRGGIPHSKALEDALFRLGGILSARNPRNQYLEFSEDDPKVVKETLNDWFPDTDTRRDLNKMAATFNHVTKNVSAQYA